MRKIAFSIVGILVLVGLTLILWRTGSAYEPSKIDAHLRGMRAPYRAVTISCCICGHLGFRVVAADGKTNQFAVIARSRSESAPDGMWMWDASSGHDTNVTAVAMNADTRRMLVGLVDQHIPPGLDRDQGLVVLRGDPRDHAAVVGHVVAARLKERLSK